MTFNSVPIEVQQKTVNTRRVFEFYSYVNVHEQYLRDKVVITAQFNRRSPRAGVTIHFSDPGRRLFAGNSIRYTDGVVLELHRFTRREYFNPL